MNKVMIEKQKLENVFIKKKSLISTKKYHF